MLRWDKLGGKEVEGLVGHSHGTHGRGTAAWACGIIILCLHGGVSGIFVMHPVAAGSGYIIYITVAAGWGFSG